MALILKRASASRTSGEWREDDYDVLADGNPLTASADVRVGATPSIRCPDWTNAAGFDNGAPPRNGIGLSRPVAKKDSETPKSFAEREP